MSNPCGLSLKARRPGPDGLSRKADWWVKNARPALSLAFSRRETGSVEWGQRRCKLKLLLVGEYGPFLQTLLVALARRGFITTLAGDRNTMKEALGDSNPDAVVFDHTRPSDLFVLNPRRSGFDGPLLLLTDDLNPTPAQELRALLVLRKPFKLASLYEQITLLTQGAA